MRPNEAKMASAEWTFSALFSSVVKALATVLVLSRTVSGQVSITQPVHKVWTVNEGGKLIIVCTSPIGGSVDWLHNDVPIATSLGRNRFTVRTVAVGNQLRHYLTVKDVRQQDAGRYTCRQTYSDHRHINVSRLNALQLVEPTKSALTLQAGDNVTFVCIGDNAAVIAWYQSNRLVTLASRDVSLKFDRDYDANRQTALLTRAGVLGDATGDYQCRDQNHHIGNSRVIRLHVVSPVAEQSVNNNFNAAVWHGSSTTVVTTMLFTSTASLTSLSMWTP